MKKIKILTLLSTVVLSAPLVYSISCGQVDYDELYGDGSDIDPLDIANHPDHFEVVMSADYAPYNFIITEAQHKKIEAQAASDADIVGDNLSPDQADKFLSMTNIAHEGNEKVYIGGYDVKVAKELVVGTSKALDIYVAPFEQLLPTVAAGNADAAIDGITNTPSRDAKAGVDFSSTYYQPKNGLLFDKAKFPQGKIGIENLDGMTIGVQRGTIQHEILKDLKSTIYPDMSIEAFDSTNGAMVPAVWAELDGFFCEDIVAEFEMDMQPNKYGMSDFDDITHFNNEANNIAIAVKEGYDLTSINKAVDKFVNEGAADDATNRVNKQVLDDSAMFAAWVRNNR